MTMFPNKNKKGAMNASMNNNSFDDSFNSLQGDPRFANETVLSVLMKRKSRRALRRHWKAQKEAKVVRKSAKYVDKYVKELTAGLPFLQNTPNQPIAKFRRSEIVIRTQLGKGVFARVYDIKDFDLQGCEGEAAATAESRLQLIQEFENENFEALSGDLRVIPENSGNDAAEDNEGLRSDLVSIGTSSTAPPSAPTTPPPTPTAAGTNASRSRGPIIRPSLRNSMRSSVNSTSYRRSFLSDSQLKREQSTLRIQVRDDLRNGKANYSLKHLTNTLLRNPKDFYSAAAALLIEVKYLSKLNHPNIVKLKGLAMGSSKQGDITPGSRRFSVEDGEGQDGFESGHCDSYFIISERLTDTLDRRIRQWKKDQPTHKHLSAQTSEQKIQTWRLMMRKTSYALQIANALHYMHQRNLLYRDLKPQNIGFVGDNETIAIFNFGLCRELDPDTKTVTEDEITAMYGKLSWRYTAVECFSQEAPALLSEALAHGTRLISHSARFDLSKRGSSLFAKYSRHRKENVPSLDALEEELQQLQEQVSSDDERSRGTVASVPLPSKTTLELSGFWDGHSVAKPSYNEKVDIYSWAMVYYEMLTLNQPFAKMSQREHYRNVCGRTLNGYEGGQRPGVYQYNLTPSMISLLQRAWDQCPSKRPNMESVGRNLQTILRELEEMIKAEQRKMALAITAGGDAILVTGQHKTTEKQQQQRYNVTQKQNSEKGSVFMRKNKKKHPPPTSAVVPLPDNTVSSPKTDKERDISWSSEIDLAALEYENWDDLNDEMDDEESELDDSDEESKLSGDEESTEKASNDGSSPLHLGNDNGPGSSDLNSVEVDPVGGTIANKHRSETKTLPSSRARSSSNQSGTLRRMRSKSAMPSNKKSRRFDSEYFERRTTNRLSRRTIRLSGRSMWLLHKRDPKVMLLFVAITFLILLGAGSAGYHWYQKKQNSVLGVPLDELAGLNRTGAMAKLQEKINIRCQRDVPPIEYPTLPLLFKGGALTPYDDDCIVQLQKDAEEQLALKLNWTDLEDDITLSSSPIQKNSTNQECGFLKMHSFDAPPPTKKQRKSKWQRKKPWKFFRDQE